MNIVGVKNDGSTSSKIEFTIQVLFYLLVLLYFVGKVFKPITLIIDLLFLYQISKDVNKTIIKEYYDKYKKLILSFFVFVLYILLQSLLLDYNYYTFKSSFETILYIILVFAAIYNFNSKKKVRNMIYVSYFILMFLFIDSLYQYLVGVDFFGQEMYGNGRRITAWQDSPLVSMMMGQFFGLLIASIFIFKDNKKILAIIVFSLSLLLFILAGNRSPILALFTSILIIGLFSNKKKYLFMILSLCAILFSLSFLNLKLNKAYSDLLNPTTNKATSGRLLLFDVGYEAIKDNLILGIGSHNYRFYYKKYFEKIDKSKYSENYVKKWSEITPTHVHSVGIDIVLSYGILGTLIFIYILIQIYNKFIKGNEIGLLASIGFLYCITPFQFGRNFTMGDWQFITYLGLIFLIIISSYRKLKED
ncbi:MAG: O-antigen ligase family protein [Campylobacterota bacterium]